MNALKKNSGISTAAKRNVMPRKRGCLLIERQDESFPLRFCAGGCHDFRLFKESRINCRRTFFRPLMLVVSGLTGIHPSSQTQVKKTKLHPLDNKQKASNRVLSQKRIVIEHIFCKLKVFRVARERYQNRRKRFGLRFSLIAARWRLKSVDQALSEYRPFSK